MSFPAKSSKKRSSLLDHFGDPDLSHDEETVNLCPCGSDAPKPGGWIQCDNTSCQAWLHAVCVGLNLEDEKATAPEPFFCPTCQTNERLRCRYLGLSVDCPSAADPLRQVLTAALVAGTGSYSSLPGPAGLNVFHGYELPQVMLRHCSIVCVLAAASAEADVIAASSSPSPSAISLCPSAESIRTAVMQSEPFVRLSYLLWFWFAPHMPPWLRCCAHPTVLAAVMLGPAATSPSSVAPGSAAASAAAPCSAPPGRGPTSDIAGALCRWLLDCSVVGTAADVVRRREAAASRKAPASAAKPKGPSPNRDTSESSGSSSESDSASESGSNAGDNSWGGSFVSGRRSKGNNKEADAPSRVPESSAPILARCSVAAAEDWVTAVLNAMGVPSGAREQLVAAIPPAPSKLWPRAIASATCPTAPPLASVFCVDFGRYFAEGAITPLIRTCSCVASLGPLPSAYFTEESSQLDVTGCPAGAAGFVARLGVLPWSVWPIVVKIQFMLQLVLGVLNGSIANTALRDAVIYGLSLTGEKDEEDAAAMAIEGTRAPSPASSPFPQTWLSPLAAGWRERLPNIKPLGEAAEAAVPSSPTVAKGAATAGVRRKRRTRDSESADAAVLRGGFGVPLGHDALGISYVWFPPPICLLFADIPATATNTLSVAPIGSPGFPLAAAFRMRDDGAVTDDDTRDRLYNELGVVSDGNTSLPPGFLYKARPSKIRAIKRKKGEKAKEPKPAVVSVVSSAACRYKPGVAQWLCVVSNAQEAANFLSSLDMKHLDEHTLAEAVKLHVLPCFPAVLGLVANEKAPEDSASKTSTSTRNLRFGFSADVPYSGMRETAVPRAVEELHTYLCNFTPAVLEPKVVTLSIVKPKYLDNLRSVALSQVRCPICGRTDSEQTSLMACCDICECWYHLSCVGLDEESAASIDAWICFSCEAPVTYDIPNVLPRSSSKRLSSGHFRRAVADDTQDSDQDASKSPTHAGAAADADADVGAEFEPAPLLPNAEVTASDLSPTVPATA